MRPQLLMVVLTFVAVALLSQGTVTAEKDAVPAGSSIDAGVPVPRVLLRAQGKMHLVYELHITNVDRQKRVGALKRLDIVDSDGRVLASYGGEDLGNRLWRQKKWLGLASVRESVLFAWVSLDLAAPRPIRLKHRLSFRTGGNKLETTAECCEVPLGLSDPLLIGPPLRGGGWLAAHGPADGSSHRRAVWTTGKGRYFISQRFAIDWARFGPDGKLMSRSGKNNADFYGYGAEALAVADAIVHAVRDGVPENIPGSKPRLSISNPEAFTGNEVWLDLGQGRYALYAHLQPGSIRVKLGDRVQRGQVLGLVGNSGNANGPHLHFHVSDRPSAVESEGIPYEFEKFWEEGEGHDFQLHPAGCPQLREKEIPLEGAVVRFP